jgi:hypothetical protein
VISDEAILELLRRSWGLVDDTQVSRHYGGMGQGLGIVALCPFIHAGWVGGSRGPGSVPGVVRAGGCDAGVPGRFGGSRWRADRGCRAIWLWPSGRFRRIL